MSSDHLHPLIPGRPLPGDWFAGPIPANIQVGDDVLVDSSFCFKHFYSRQTCGLKVGRRTTIWRTSLATEPSGFIEIGEESYLANASLVCMERIVIGSRVMISGGATLADSDFHPIEPALRLADSVALSPVGDRRRRPAILAAPVFVEDDVWIGFNAVILKGVRIGQGACVQAGAVVLRDVPAGSTVAGNPAQLVEQGAGPGR